MWQELIGLLLSLAKQYEELYSLQEKKRDSLVVLDLIKLENIIKLEEIYAGEIEKLEKKRLELLVRMSSEVRGVSEATNMQDLTELAPSVELKRAISTANTALNSAHKKAKELIEGNSLLIEGALMAVNRSLGTIGNAKVDPLYGRGGSESTNHKNKFDFKA